MLFEGRKFAKAVDFLPELISEFSQKNGVYPHPVSDEILEWEWRFKEYLIEKLNNQNITVLIVRGERKTAVAAEELRYVVANRLIHYGLFDCLDHRLKDKFPSYHMGDIYFEVSEKPQTIQIRKAPIKAVPANRIGLAELFEKVNNIMHTKEDLVRRSEKRTSTILDGMKGGKLIPLFLDDAQNREKQFPISLFEKDPMLDLTFLGGSGPILGPLEFRELLIFFKKTEVEIFLNDIDVKSVAGSNGGLRNATQRSDENRAAEYFKSLGRAGTPQTPQTKKTCLDEASRQFATLSGRALERAWQNGAHASRKAPGAKRKKI